MTFKLNWERSDAQYMLPTGIISKMVAIVYPDKKLRSHQIISGGCANINVQLQFEENKYPLILRIYLRDEGSAYREQKIGNLLDKRMPVPHIHYIGNVNGYYFAIAEFMPGNSLRNLLLNDEPCDISSIMHEVGILLSEITHYKFSETVFFDQNLQVIEHIDRNGYISFAKECLQHTIVASQLSSETLVKIGYYLNKHEQLLPDKNEKHLVHGDFDPANILVEKFGDTWKVNAILDWEFSFSGSVLWDVANILRYSHQISPKFQDAFLAGLKSGGIILPEDWRTTIHILNLLSLLDCLKRSDPQNSPNQCTDIRELIGYILFELGKR